MLMSNVNKSALTHHATSDTYTVDWQRANIIIIDENPNRRTRQIKEAIWIRKTKLQHWETRAITSYLTYELTSFVVSIRTIRSVILRRSTCVVQRNSLQIKETFLFEYEYWIISNTCCRGRHQVSILDSIVSWRLGRCHISLGPNVGTGLPMTKTETHVIPASHTPWDYINFSLT